MGKLARTDVYFLRWSRHGIKEAQFSELTRGVLRCCLSVNIDQVMPLAEGLFAIAIERSMVQPPPPMVWVA